MSNSFFGKYGRRIGRKSQPAPSASRRIFRNLEWEGGGVVCPPMITTKFFFLCGPLWFLGLMKKSEDFKNFEQRRESNAFFFDCTSVYAIQRSLCCRRTVLGQWEVCIQPFRSSPLYFTWILDRGIHMIKNPAFSLYYLLLYYFLLPSAFWRLAL